MYGFAGFIVDQDILWLNGKCPFIYEVDIRYRGRHAFLCKKFL